MEITQVLTNLGSKALATTLEILPHVAGAAAVGFIGYQASNWAVKYGRGPIARTFKRDGAVKIILSSLRFTIIFATAITAVSILGVDLTPLLAGAGALGIVLGVTLAPLLQRQISGYFVMSDKIFEVGDKIEIVGMTPAVVGFVDRISMTSTRIKSINGTFLTIPNSTILNKDIINYSSEELKTLFDIPVTISYESDVDQAMAIMLKVANDTSGVRKSGTIEMGSVERSLTPSVWIKELNTNGVHMVLSVWSSDPFFGRASKSFMLKRILEEFKTHGIEISHQKVDLHVKPAVVKDMPPTIELH
jgi:small conductance mechanosensitive channel